MANSTRARSTCAAGALSERLRRVSSWRSSAASGRRGSVWWRDMGHLGARGSPHHYTTSHGKRPTRCVVPESRGALSRDEEDALWQAFYTAAPAQRREFEPSSKRRKRRPAASPSAMG